jgi:hypothetical protein
LLSSDAGKCFVVLDSAKREKMNGLMYQHLTIDLKKLVLQNCVKTFNGDFPAKIN